MPRLKSMKLTASSSRCHAICTCTSRIPTHITQRPSALEPLQLRLRQRSLMASAQQPLKMRSATLVFWPRISGKTRLRSLRPMRPQATSLYSQIKLRSTFLERGHHARYGVVKCGIAVKVRLAELRKQLEVSVPAPLIDAFANGVRGIARGGHLTRTAVCRCGRDDRADDFSRRIENERVPEVARNTFFALSAFADDGLLDRFGDAVRGFVKKHFQRFSALIARVNAGNRDAQRIKRGVSALSICVGAHVDADFFLRPLRFINIRET